MNFEDIETRLHSDAAYCRSNDFILDCNDFVCQHTGLSKSKAEKIVSLLDSRATSAMDLLLAVGEFVSIFEE